MGSNRAEVNLGQFYTTDGEWKLLYQSARCHSLQDCKHRHTQTCSDESSFVQNCTTSLCLLTFYCYKYSTLRLGEKQHTETKTQ